MGRSSLGGVAAFVDEGTGPHRLLVDRWGGPLALQIGGFVALLTAVGPATTSERGTGMAIAAVAAVCGLALLRWGPRIPLRVLDLGIPLAVVLIVLAAVNGGELRVAAPSLSILVATSIFAQRSWRASLVAAALLGLGYAVVLAHTDHGPAPASRWLIVMTAVVSSGAIVHWIRDQVLSLVGSEQAARERAEVAAARLADLDGAKSAFLERMSHELRTPLNAVLGFTAMLREERVGPLTEAQAEYLGDVETAGVHLLELVDDLLDVDQLGTEDADLVLAPHSVADAVEDSVRFIRERADRGGVRVSTSVARDLPIVVADGRKVRQALLNLVANAVRFTRPGGHVRIRAWSDALSIHIAVEDTGIGIAPDDQRRMFARFEQASTDGEGTGLGLPLSRRFIEQHGGRLDVQSAPGKGSTFTVVLPLRPPAGDGRVQPNELPTTDAETEPNVLHDALMRRGSEANLRLVADLGRSLGLLAAGLALALAVVTPGDLRVRMLIGGVAIAALTFASALPRATMRTPSVALELAIPFGAALTAVMVALSGSFSDLTALAFGWIIAVSFAPWSRSSGVPHVVFAAACYAAVLLVIAGPGSEVERWVSIVGAFVLQGLVIRALVAKLQLVIFAEREARRTAEGIEMELSAATKHKDDFIANMSHELRTPLNAIVGFSDVVLAGTAGELTEEQAEYVAIVLAAGRHLLALVEDILQLAKLDARRMVLDSGDVVLADVVERAVNSRRPESATRQVELTVTSPLSTTIIEADALLLEHAISRLVARVAASATAGSSVQIELSERGADVVLAIDACGQWQTAGAPDQLFDSADEWEERDGSGLTRAIVGRVAELHGGALLVTSDRGTTRCELRLPAGAPSSRRAKAPA